MSTRLSSSSGVLNSMNTNLVKYSSRHLLKGRDPTMRRKETFAVYLPWTRHAPCPARARVTGFSKIWSVY